MSFRYICIYILLISKFCSLKLHSVKLRTTLLLHSSLQNYFPQYLDSMYCQDTTLSKVIKKNRPALHPCLICCRKTSRVSLQPSSSSIYASFFSTVAMMAKNCPSCCCLVGPFLKTAAPLLLLL